MPLEKVVAQQPWDFFSVPSDREQRCFITPSQQPSFSSYFWCIYFVANIWMIMNNYVQAIVKILTDLKDNEYNLFVLFRPLIATSSIVRTSHRRQNSSVTRGKLVESIDSHRGT